MFCPRCGVALPRVLEVCSACRADLRPLVATGFFPALPASRPAASDEGITGAHAAAEDDSTMSGAAPVEPATDADLTREGPVLSESDDLTVLRLPPVGAEDADATREEPAIQSRGVREPTPAAPRHRPSSSSGGSRPRTGGSGPSGSPDGPLQVGQMLGTRYHIIRLLGIGGMGAVYQAWDSELEVALAFKVIRPDAIGDPVAAAAVEARFKRELLLARQVTHPNVVRIHDLGEIDGMKYITMPYIEGRDLSDILAESPTLPVPRVLSFAKQVASGLSAAHKAGVVHRDLKPANIMIDAEDRALIMDFGIARGTGDAIEERAGDGVSRRPRRSQVADETRVGTVVGTIEYMAPEQARAEPVDQRVDIYALGLIISRMLVGRRFAEGATDAYTDLLARMNAEPRPLREIDSNVPEAIERIVSKCLQPDPAGRYQTTADLLHELERLDENGVPLPEPTPFYRTWRFWTVAAALTTVLVGGTWWFAQLFAPVVPVVHEPVSVLFADFANGTGDRMFDGVLEQSLGVAVERASFVTAYDRRNALRVATQLGAGKTLDETVARIVAQREGVKLVLAGGIVSDGAGYRLSARGINPADGSQTFSTEVRASTKEGVLNAIGRLGGDIRESLGDTETAGTPAANEMLSAASLEAVAEYIQGQELTRQGRDEEAIPYFERATRLDKNFGRAYSAHGTALFKLDRPEKAEEQYKKALSLLDRMTEREKFRTLGAYYLAGPKNYQLAIENYEALVAKYPSDASAYNNLAVAYTNTRNFAKASEHGRKALEIYPRNRLYQSNYALYAMYAGDFKASAAEAQNLLKEDPNYFMAYLPLAMEALSRGDTAAAKAFYTQMGQVNARAASLASIGLADVAIFEGETEDAIAVLTEGVKADLEAKSEARAGVKRIAIAEALELEGNQRAAESAAREAVALSKSEPVVVPAGRIFAAGRRQDDVDSVVQILANQFEPQKRAYARIIDALDYMGRRRYVDAVDSLNAAKGFADLWLANFYLGVAYASANRPREAFSAFEACMRRRGEATALFIDEVPTYRYLAALPYWMARAQEGLGQTAQARVNFEAFLAQKKGPTRDPLVADARERLKKLAAR
jgi:serine/threonine protein kinase/tetratricopeptide (TPR) repeat protein